MDDEGDGIFVKLSVLLVGCIIGLGLLFLVGGLRIGVLIFIIDLILFDLDDEMDEEIGLVISLRGFLVLI